MFMNNLNNNDERDLDSLLTLLNKNNPYLTSLQDIKKDVEYIFNNFYNNIKKYNIDSNFIENIKKDIRNKTTNDKIIVMMIVNKLLFKTFY